MCAETIYKAVQSTVMRSIHDRPAHVESRRQAGHWEGDLIVGSWQRSAIATLIERKTRLTVLVRLHEDHSAQTVGNALIAAFKQLPPQLRRTLTWDQGNEMFQHAASRPPPGCGSTSPIRTRRGNVARTRTPTVCAVSTFPRAPT